MNYDHEDQTISLVEIWHKLWLHKFLILIVTTTIGIILTFGLYFSFKGQQITYTGFEYNFVNIAEEKFPDGSLFDFRDIISFDYLKSIQSSKSIYENIDIESLFLDENTAIEKQLSIYSTTDQIQYSNNRYTLSIPFKYFNYDETLAISFIEDLINSTIETATEKNITLEIYNYVELVTDNVEYIDAIDYYLKQYELLLSETNSFIATYGDVTFNLISIQDIKERLISAYDNSYTYEEISTLITDESYYKNATTFVKRLELRIAQIQKEYDLNVLKIDELENLYNDLVANSNLQQADVLLSEIANYRIENVEYQFMIDQYQENINKTSLLAVETNSSTEFIDIINDIETFLNEYTDEYNEFYLNYVNSETRVIYDQGSLITVNGGYSIVIIGAISFIVGLLLSFGIVFIIESESFKTKTLTNE
jgi:hypothetical protein